MKLIELTQGQRTVVDDDVWLWAHKFKWGAHRNRRQIYVQRGLREGGKVRHFLLHREIMKAPFGVLCDHKDGDGLNNLRSNLRLCDVLQNTCNQQKRLNNTSGFKGVSFFRQNGTWRARIMVSGHSRFLGYFKTALEAAQAYDRAAIELHGEFARLNFPKV